MLNAGTCNRILTQFTKAFRQDQLRQRGTAVKAGQSQNLYSIGKRDVFQFICKAESIFTNIG